MIIISPSTKKRCKVQYYGANGEMLSSTEILATTANAHKNIKAMEILMSGSPQVVDKTKVAKGSPDGLERKKKK